MMGDIALVPSQQRRPVGDLILAGASVRSLAQSAIRDGLRPICVDMFNDADLQHWLQQCGLPNNLLCISGFADVVDQLRDLSSEIPLIPVGGLENAASIIRNIRQQRPVWLSDEGLIQAVRDPEFLFPVLQKYGCAVPEYRVEPPAAGAGRWLRKLRRSAGGMGICWHGSDSQAPDPEVYWQEFLDGIPLSATFVNCPDSDQDVSVSSNVDRLQWLGCALQLSGCAALHAGEFQFCGNAGPINVSADLQCQIAHTAQTIVKHWPLQGVFGLDFMVCDGAAVLLEVNPRPTASHELHEWAAELQPGHVVRHASAWRNSAMTLPTLPAPAQRPAPMDGRWCARLVLYAEHDVCLSNAVQQSLLSACLPVRLGTSFAGVSGEANSVILSSGTPAERQNWKAIMGSRPTVWLADVPAAETRTAAGTPFCSIYLAGDRFSLSGDHLGDRLEWDQRTQQMLKMLPGNVVLSLSRLLRQIREQIAVLR